MTAFLKKYFSTHSMVCPKEEDDCPICLQVMSLNNEVVELPCSHSMHSDCFKLFFSFGYKHCPLCKYNFSSTTCPLPSIKPLLQNTLRLMIMANMFMFVLTCIIVNTFTFAVILFYASISMMIGILAATFFLAFFLRWTTMLHNPALLLDMEE